MPLVWLLVAVHSAAVSSWLGTTIMFFCQCCLCICNIRSLQHHHYLPITQCAHLDHLLQHGLGDVDEEQGVGVVGCHTDKLMAVVVRWKHVHRGVPQLEEDAAISASSCYIARYHNVVPKRNRVTYIENVRSTRQKYINNSITLMKMKIKTDCSAWPSFARKVQ